jgi:hypothetical protein
MLSTIANTDDEYVSTSMEVVPKRLKSSSMCIRKFESIQEFYPVREDAGWKRGRDVNGERNDVPREKMQKEERKGREGSIEGLCVCINCSGERRV